MTREERIKLIELAISKGYSTDTETGKVYGPTGKESISKIKGYTILQIYTNRKARVLYAHVFIWYNKYKEVVDEIDHINNNRSDNRISNLRSVTRSINAFNRTKKAKGYCFCKHRKDYMAYIRVDGKTINLGRFKFEDDAINARYMGVKKYYNQSD